MCMHAQKRTTLPSSQERQSDKMPVEPVSSLFEQNKQELLVNFERTSENKSIAEQQEQPVELQPSKGLIKCEFCGKEGKVVFFATKHDLDLHVKAKHSVKFAVSPVLGGQVVEC